MNLDTPIEIVITPSILLAIFFLVVASWVRRQSLESKKNWNKAWDATAPSLKEGPPPMVTASRGVTGCVSWIVGWFFFLLCIALFWDYALFEGESARYVWGNLGEWTEALISALLSLLRSLARAVL